MTDVIADLVTIVWPGYKFKRRAILTRLYPLYPNYLLFEKQPFFAPPTPKFFDNLGIIKTSVKVSL